MGSLKSICSINIELNGLQLSRQFSEIPDNTRNFSGFPEKF